MTPRHPLAELDSLMGSGSLPIRLTEARPLDPRLHPYQRRAVAHLWRWPRSCLFLEMGLGKTATVLQALTPEHGPVLVVAPKRVAETTWPTEAATWRPDLTVEVAAGTAANRRRVLSESTADVVTVGRDNVADIPAKRFRTVVLDELSSFKNRSTARWRATMKVCKTAAYVWGLTGTPSPNGYLDLWAQMALIDRGVRLGKSLGSYRSRYFTASDYIAGGKPVGWEPKPGAQKWIDRQLSDVCVSMRAEDYLDLPPVIHNTVTVPVPSAKVQRAYDSMRRELVAQVDDSTDVTAMSAAVASGKLSQITSGFLYLDDEPGVPAAAKGARRADELHRAKMDAVRELVEQVTEGGVLIFYRFLWERDQLAKMLPEAEDVKTPGVIERWNAGQIPVMLAHPASAGHGLNLQAGGHTIIWTSPTWSLEGYLQANARLARQGQTRPVIIHHVIMAGTVDEQVRAVIEGKRSTQDALMIALGIDK